MIERASNPLPVIVYTLAKLDHGGAEMRSIQLISHLRREHPTLTIVIHSTSTERGRLHDQFVEAGAIVVRGRPGIGGLPDFWRSCRRHRATVAHVNHGMVSGYYLLMAFLAGVSQRFCHLRSDGEPRTTVVSRMIGLVGVSLVRIFCTRVVGVSAAARRVPRIPERSWRTIFNGVACDPPHIELGRRSEPRDGCRTLIVLGRMAPGKNCLRAVSIFEHLVAREGDRKLRLRFVGGGRAEDVCELERRVAASPVASQIVMHGFTNEPLQALRDGVLLLFPSSSEGLPGVVLEALSVGTPVVASDIPAVREIARRVTGIFVTPLAGPEEVWSDQIVIALREERAAGIIGSFRRGPFLLETYAAEMAALWSLPRAVGAPHGSSR